MTKYTLTNDKCDELGRSGSHMTGVSCLLPHLGRVMCKTQWVVGYDMPLLEDPVT